MAATIVGTPKTNNGFATTIEISAPDDIIDGDLLCAIYMVSNDISITINEAGWTEVIVASGSAGGDKTVAFSYKTASSESGTYTIDQTGAAAQMIATTFGIRGYNETEVIDVTSLENETQDSATHTPAPITASANNDTIITALAFVQSSTSASAPAGYTKVSQLTAGDNGLIVAANEGVGVGVESPGSFNLIQSSADAVSITIAIKSAAAAAGVAPQSYYYRHVL